MTVIDHSFFPHLIDLIWINLDYEGQLAARRVCTEWKQRADGRLHHLRFELDEGLGAPSITVSARDLANSSAPLVYLHRWLEDAVPIAQPTLSPHAKKSEHPEPTPISRHLQIAISQRAQVIDFVGFEFKTDILSNIFLNEERSPGFDKCIFRWFECPVLMVECCSYPPEEAITNGDVVMFELHPCEHLQAPHVLDLRNRRTSVAVNYVCYADPTTVSLNSSALWYDRLYVITAPIVVIFHDRRGPTVNRNTAVLKVGVFVEYGKLLHLGCTADVVGLEEFFEPAAVGAYIKLVKEEIMKNRIMIDDEDDEYDWIPEPENLERLRFWTHAEYREHVGEDTYRIQTVR